MILRNASLRKLFAGDFEEPDTMPLLKLDYPREIPKLLTRKRPDGTMRSSLLRSNAKLNCDCIDLSPPREGRSCLRRRKRVPS